MVLLILNNDEWENDSRVMIKAFCPEAVITTNHEESSYDMTVRVNVDDDTDNTMDGGVVDDSNKTGNSVRISLDILCPGQNPSNRISAVAGDKKTVRNELKRMMYDSFSQLFGKELPWGTLTGVRPTKIVYAMLEEGKTSEEIAAYMKKEYYVSSGKIKLAESVAKKEMEMLSKIDYNKGYSLYLGIPFCPTTCLYCSFTSFPLVSWKNRTDMYVDALIKEMRYTGTLMKDRILDTFYMGGGTPTTLEPAQLDRVLGNLEDIYDLSKLKEYTVEAGRPDSITKEKLMVLKKHGVDRISINPQTMNDKTLKLIGRHHSVEQVKEAFMLARDCGFDNINMDLIVGLPNESEADVRHTLEEVTKLSPDSLTVHSLAIKRASRLNILWEQYKDCTILNTDEIIDMTRETAGLMGMAPYYLYRQKNMAGNFENVGYARPGKEGLYNILIMEEKQTIMAVGAGASTKVVFPSENRIERVENVKDVTTYIENIDEMIERKRRFFS